MSRRRWITFLFLMAVGALLTLFAVVGMIFIFNASSQLKRDVADRRCEHLVLGEAVHEFHVSLAQLEADENNHRLEEDLIKKIINEPDISLAMQNCRNHS